MLRLAEDKHLLRQFLRHPRHIRPRQGEQDIGLGFLLPLVVGGTDPVRRIPVTNLPQPPLVPTAPASAPATLGTTAMERDRAVAPGKRMRLENGQYLAVPESWTPEDPTI